MNLYFMRHGIALPTEDSATPSDHERPLSSKGTKRTRRAAKGIRRLGLSFDVVLTSPLVRARQTAEIVCAALTDEIPIVELPTLAPECPVDALMADLGSYRDRANLLLVGHEPSLSKILSHLLHGKGGLPLGVGLKKGTLCRIQLDTFPPTGPATLGWLLTPKQLRLLGTVKAEK